MSCRNVTKNDPDKKQNGPANSAIYSFVSFVVVTFTWTLVTARFTDLGEVVSDRSLEAVYYAALTTVSATINIYIIFTFIRGKPMGFKMMLILVTSFTTMAIVVILIFPW